MFCACAARARVFSLCICICQSVYLFACFFVCLCLCLSTAICTFILTLHIEGCKTYRRTFYDRVKQSSIPMKAKKKIISRKHRVNCYNGCYYYYNIISLQSYERRSKAVRGAKEQKYWRDVMSK